MLRSKSSNPNNGPGVLQTFFLLIFLTTVIAQTDPIGHRIDDAGGASNLYTHPATGSSVPPDSTDPGIPRWVTQDSDSRPTPPSLQNVHNRTYTAVYIPAGNSFTYNISFQFYGTRVQVYLVLSNQAPTNCDFVLDENSDSVTFNESTTDDYQYQKLAYSSTVLDPQMHKLEIRVAGSPDRANYLNFDFAQFTPPPPNATYSAGDLNLPSGNATTTSSSLSTTPSPTETNRHETAKAIAGGVVGGFLAVVTLICVASFYRHRRLRELEETVHPLAINPNASAMSSTSAEERHHLMSLSISQSRNHHHHTPSWQPSTHASSVAGVTPFTLQSPASADPLLRPLPTAVHFGHPDSHPNAEYTNRVRQERQRELHHRLETVTTQMRQLKSSYNQQRLRGQHQQAQHSGYSERNRDPDLPVIRLVPGGFPDPVLGRYPGSAPMPSGGELMVTPAMLTDMRQQMQIMMNQIQYLQAQQNSPYAQGLTDEPPPGYTEVINPHHD